jgi:hypothetical protein
MEGVAAALIASIADGDMQIGVRAALSVSLFALIARLGSLVNNKRNARRILARIARALFLPTTASARRFVTELASPFGSDADDDDVAESMATAAPTPAAAPAAVPSVPASVTQFAPWLALRARWEKLRPYLWLPFAGPLVMTGFLGGIVNVFVLGPLLSLAWRQRKYMADATAVRLTRDPDTLAGALEQMARARGAPLAPWAAHMSVVSHDGRQRGLFGSSVVPMFPSIDRRLRALGRMGAHLMHTAHKIPLRTLLIGVPLLLVVAGLVAILLPLIVWLSLALTALFGGIPFAILHGLLRWLGHQ